VKEDLDKKGNSRIKNYGLGKQNVNFGREYDPGIHEDHNEPEQRSQPGKAEKSQ